MNRQIKALGVIVIICYVAVFAKLNQVQVLQAQAYSDRPDNTRQLQRDFNQPRGDILTADGKTAATSEERRAALRYQRVYPDGELLSAVTGYYSFTLGSDGVERTYNEELAGRTPSLKLHRLSGFFSDTSSEGDVVLTVRKDLQETARDALGDRRGSVVALDPRTGAILANVSAPHYDPQQLVLDPRADEAKELARVQAYWAALNDPKSGNPLVLRGTQGLYVPGSIFKTVTVGAALDSGVISTDRVYPDPGEIVIDGHRIVELNRPQPVKDRYTVTEGYLYSLNIVFAQVALDLGTVRMNEYARHFGFGQEIPFVSAPNAADTTAVASRISNDPNYLSDKPALADTGFGQGELQVSPLHMALIAATMANGGKTPEPYLVGAIRAPDGHSLVYQARPKTWLTPINGGTADQVRKLMIASVESGGSQRARIDGLVVGGKTGTAEIGDGDSHSWFICFAGRPNQPPEIAIAVIVERGGSGSTAALPIARSIIEAYFR